MSINLSCFAGVGQQFFDNSGVPLSGGLIYSYAAGTTTPATTYTTSAGNVAHTNPIVLDAAGKVPNGGQIWVEGGLLFKYVVKTSTGTLLNTYDNVPGQVGAEAITSTILNPLMFGAIGDGVANDTAALNAMFAAASGRTIDGLGKTYKVVPDTIIDPYATIGVGYGQNKKWFCVVNCTRLQNMGFIGSVSFGNPFFGKWLSVSSVTITGDCRISSWYVNYDGLNISGTTWFGGDVPPVANYFGFYYNNFDNCSFSTVICDQRYGPVNLNNWRECRFDTWWVKNTGYVGWTAGSYPYQSFHMNQFLACEWFSSTGIVAPDTYTYVAVIGDTLGNGVTSGGTNRVIGAYNESSVRGFYGDSWQIENIHFSGEPGQYMGGGQIAYNIPFMGEPTPQAGEARVAPAVYPMGNVAWGGDWSILNSSGYPYCFDPTGMSVTVVSDSTEPTGLGKAALVSGSAFSTLAIRTSVHDNGGTNNGACSYCLIYKPVSGDSPIIEAFEPGSSSIYYGTATITRLSNGWLMAYGVCGGYVRFTSANSFSFKISAVAMGRGAGVMSAFTNQQGGRPLIDLSGGNSLVKDNISAALPGVIGNSGAYVKSNAKTIAASSTNDFFTVNLGAYSGNSIRIAALYKTSSTSGGARTAYRESIVNESGGATLTEQNITNITGLNLGLSFVLSGATLTVRTTTSASESEGAYVTLELLGPSTVYNMVTVL